MRIRLLILLIPALLAGCTLGPNYRKPAVALPGEFRGAPPDASDASIANRKWSGLFHDETLSDLIATALKQNFDVGIAAERVQEARARFGIARGRQLPSLSVAAQAAANRPALIGASLLAPNTPSLDTS